MIVPFEIVMFVTIISNKNNLLVIITNMFLLYLKSIFTCMCMHVCVYACIYMYAYVCAVICMYVCVFHPFGIYES